MYIYYPRNSTQTSLLYSIIFIGTLIVFATVLGKDTVKIVTDIVYIPVTAAQVALSTLLCLRFKQAGNHGKAWLFFLGFSISWFIAETIWSTYELVFKVSPFPSLADVFFISGYPLLFCFLIYYLKPVMRDVSRRITISAILISAAIAIPSVYMAYDFDPKVSMLENTLATSYPIADAILLVPALIGMSLFFRGEVNFTWSLICFAIILQTIADAGFQLTTFTNTYYTGHPVDIVFLWSYLLFSFGVYDHIKIFKKEKTDDKFKELGR